MKEIKEYEKDIASIRTMMERSAKFISLSGLSGVMAGVYALAGATAAYYLADYPLSPRHYSTSAIREGDALWKLVAIAAVVLVASVATVLLFSRQKAKKHNIQLWSPASKTLLVNMAIPLVTGGLFILVMLYNGHLGLAAPACLIFYGIALIQASPNTFDEIRYLGFSEILLGLISALYPGYSLIAWTIGFGVLHIVYGGIMYNKYDK